jgi:hypothetical protein
MQKTAKGGVPRSAREERRSGGMIEQDPGFREKDQNKARMSMKTKDRVK